MLTYFGLNNSEHNKHQPNAVQMLFPKTVEKSIACPRPTSTKLLNNTSCSHLFCPLRFLFNCSRLTKRVCIFRRKNKIRSKGCELMLMANSLLPKQILTTCSTKTPKRFPTKSGQPRKATNKSDPKLTRGIDTQLRGLDCKY